MKEMSATFSPAPGSDRWRPAQKEKPPSSDYFSPGDWTSNRLAVHNGGAVRSGYLAAEADSLRCRNARKLLQPDLRAEGLARLWARNGLKATARGQFLTRTQRHLIDYSQVRLIFDLHVLIQSMIGHPPGGLLGPEV